MYVNNASGGQSRNLSNTENSRQFINGMYKSNADIKLTHKNITGLTESSNGNIHLDDCQAKHSYDDHRLSDDLVRVNNGNIKINNNSYIYGSIKSSNGEISVANSVIEGDIKNCNGNISFKAGSCRAVVNSNGKVELAQATLSSVKNSNGKVVLDETTVTGDVTVSNGKLAINTSKIQGKLELNSNQLTLGSDSEVNILKLIHVETFSSESVSLMFSIHTQPGQVKINGVSYSNSFFSNNSDAGDTVKSVTQHVTLEDGSRLSKLEFTGEKCILTLEGTAEYTGFPQENLEVVRA